MITDRLLEARDISSLEESLRDDPFHPTTTPAFFTQPGTVTKVYEDDGDPVLWVRGSTALRLDIQFRDNTDFRRNLRVMLAGFPALLEQARANGFTEVIFNTNHPPLRAFCLKRLGFHDSAGELRRLT